MRYMLLIHGNHDAWTAFDQADIDRVGRTHKALQQELAASGELVDHKELALDNAVVVRSHRGAPATTDGPLDDGAWTLGGYYLVECATRDRAVQIAGRFTEAEFAPIEVRRLNGQSSWDTAAPGTRSIG